MLRPPAVVKDSMLVTALFVTAGFAMGYFWRKSEEPRELSNLIQYNLKNNSAQTVEAVVKGLQSDSKAMQTVIVRGYYRLNPSMSGYTFLDFYVNPSDNTLRTLQLSHYTRYAGGAAIFIFGKNSSGQLCVLLEANRRRKKKHWEPVQGYGNPAYLQTLDKDMLEVDPKEFTVSAEYLAKSERDTAFEQQLKGKSLTQALTSQPKQKKLVKEHFHPTLRAVIKDEIEEETGLKPEDVEIYELPFGTEVDYSSGWGLTVITQQYFGNYKGILPTEYSPKDADEIEKISPAPLKDITLNADGSGHYDDRPIPKEYMDFLKKALTAKLDKDMANETKEGFQTVASAKYVLERFKDLVPIDKSDEKQTTNTPLYNAVAFENLFKKAHDFSNRPKASLTFALNKPAQPRNTNVTAVTSAQQLRCA